MNFKETVLENGLKVVTVKKETKFASIRIGVKVGSMDENINEEGISHFVEHMMFKKTKNRDKETLHKDLAAYGGDYNAYTFKDRTVYISDTLKEDLSSIMEVLSDMLINSCVDINDVESERSVITSEIGIYEENFEEYGCDKALSLAFKGTDISSVEIGSRETVNSFSREQINNFYKTYYVPENTYITVVSSFDHEYIIELVNKFFGLWENTNFPRNKRKSTFNINEGRFSYEMNESTQRNVHMFFEAQNLTETEIVYLDMAMRRLGSGMSSLFFKKLRSEMALTYDTFARLNRYENTSIAECYTIVSEENVNKALSGMQECIDTLIDCSNSDDSILATRKEFLFDLTSDDEIPSRLSSYVVYEMLNGRDVDSISRKLEIIKNAKIEDIVDTAKKYLLNPCIVVSTDTKK